MTIATIVIVVIHFILLPSFWRKKARENVQAGAFSPSKDINHPQATILEIGCGDGSISAIFAGEIFTAQKDTTDLSRAAPTLPTFTGYDMWKWWSRVPNTPKAYLQTLLDAGVPHSHIVANRVDLSSKETKLRLPYGDNSIPFIICNLGLAEVCKWYSGTEQKTIFRELARILKPEGRMIILQSQAAGYKPHYAPMAPYKRLLVDELGWSQAKVHTHWAWGVLQYLDGVKLVGKAKATV